jgi:CYTH domain-containing protein
MAPPGKELKYARVERERRFLLAGRPEGTSIQGVSITDRYLPGTRIRLRRASESSDRGQQIVYKLTQKIPRLGGLPGLITTMYLSSDEYQALAALPAAVLRKSRYRLPPLGVDVFEGDRSGLCLAEAEFDSDAEMAEFTAPAIVVAEVTGDHRFTGGHLATSTRQDVAEALAAYGLVLQE